MLKKQVLGSYNLNNSEKHRLPFEDIFLETLDTYTKKMNPPSAVLGRGVHGKVCWLIAYKLKSYGEQFFSYAAPAEWKKLDVNIRSLTNLETFNERIKT